MGSVLWKGDSYLLKDRMRAKEGELYWHVDVASSPDGV